MPILGGFGNASEYAYRSFIVEIPDPFDWVDLYDVEPGLASRAGYAKITGIKSPLPIKVSIGSSYSLIANVFDNGQTVTFDNNNINEASFDEYSDPNNRFQSGLGFSEINDFVLNNQSINLSLVTPKIEKSDFSKTYTTLVSVGKTTQDWIIQTRPIDDTPSSFTFVGIGSTTTSTYLESNQIILSGLEPGFSFTSEITSGIGTINVNNIDRGFSYDVFDGDIIKLKTNSSNLFDTTTNIFDTTTNITLQVGTYSTTWVVTTEKENLNVTFTPTDFTDQSNLQLGTNYNSNQITVTDLSLNSDLPITLSNTNAKYEIERSGSVIKSFDASPIEVINNDKIRLRLTSSGSYSSLVTTDMQIGNTSADWRITTRSAPPPDPPAPPPPPTTFAPVRNVYRYFNRSNGRHVCSQNPAHPTLNGSGFFVEGVLCRAFYVDQPNPPGTFGPVRFNYNGNSFPCGKYYLSPNSNSVPLYELVNPSNGDVLWSPSINEGVGVGYQFRRTVGHSPRNSINF